MRIVRNIGTVQRIGFVIAGAVLIALPFLAAMGHWVKVALPVVGAIVLIEGLVGW